jgi:TRAP-type C4-dicarboxylate transport system substrate-binding protein
VGLALFAGPALAVDIKLAHEEITGGMEDLYAKNFKERVEKRLPDWNVEIYPVGVLGDAQDQAEQVMNGVINFDITCSNIGVFIPMIRIFAVPFVWSRDNAVNSKIMESSPALYEILGKAIDEKGMKLLSVFPEGWQIWSSNKPLKTPEDFKNLRIRVMADPLLAEVYKSYGANPQHVPYAEIYSALQLKQIDANIQPYFAHEEMSFYEQQDYMTNAFEIPFASAFVANLEWFNSLTPAEQEAVRLSATEAIAYIIEEGDKINEADKAKMLKERPNMIFYDLTDEERDKFVALATPSEKLFIEMAGPEGEKLLTELKKEIKTLEGK